MQLLLLVFGLDSYHVLNNILIKTFPYLCQVEKAMFVWTTTVSGDMVRGTLLSVVTARNTATADHLICIQTTFHTRSPLQLDNI